jgi:two-component system response regulator FixJ
MACKDTVFVVDDDEDIRSSFTRLLEQVDLKVEEFGRAADFLEAYDPARPGCLLLDIRMPEMSGTELQRTMLERDISLPIIFITGHADVAIAVECMKRGAFEFIEKPVRAQKLLDTIQRALSLDRERRSTRVEIDEAKKRYSRLTPRESQVVEFAVKGFSNRDIAREFGVSSQAIDAHRSKAMQKLGVTNVADLVRTIQKVKG